MNKGPNKVYILVLISILCFTTVVYGNTYETFTYEQENLDIMFVVDYSNSMNSNDRQKIGLQMIEAFIDEVYAPRMRVGFVAYNQNILASKAPSTLTQKAERMALKAEIGCIKRSGSTDTGAALKEAQNLLVNQPGKSVIILISDGEPDLSYVQTGRTLADSYADMNQVAEACKVSQVPIYTIAFGEKFDGATTCLEELAQQTEGKSYRAHEAGDLVGIFNTIIEKYTMSSVVPVFASLTSGELQNIDIPLISEYASEANLLLVSSEPIVEANVWYEGQEVVMNQSAYYFTAKINNPTQDQLKLQYRAPKGAYIKIYLVLYSDMIFEVTVPQAVDKGSALEVQGCFIEHKTGKRIEDAVLYESFESVLTVTSPTAVQEQTKMYYKDGKLIAPLVFQGVGTHDLDLNMKGNYYNVSLGEMHISCNQRPIHGECVINKSYPKYVRSNPVIDLDTYFQPTQQQHLTYSIKAVTGESMGYNVQDNMLQIIPQAIGKTSFQIVATDEDHTQVVSPVSTITIMPLWRYYIGLTLSVLITLGMGIMGFVIYKVKKYKNRPMPTYSGKLNVYFTKMPEEMVIPPLTFSLFQRTGKSVSLGTLLQEAGYPMEGLKLNHIIFEPGFNREMVFSQNTPYSVLISTNIACCKLKYSIAYGTKIYITVPDESYDIEIHFVSARN